MPRNLYKNKWVTVEQGGTMPDHGKGPTKLERPYSGKCLQNGDHQISTDILPKPWEIVQHAVGYNGEQMGDVSRAWKIMPISFPAVLPEVEL